MKNKYLRKIPVVLIFGPTCTGKTSLAIKLADGIGEIISADSTQVYKKLNIGANKPTKEELKKIKHYLISFLGLNEQFNAGYFQKVASKLIVKIWSKKKIPFIVGGTGLYFSSLLYGLVDIPIIKNTIRERIKNLLSIKGNIRLYSILEKIDPDYAAKISVNDSQRIVRALEVVFSTGTAFSSFHNKTNIYNQSFDFLKIGLSINRQELYNRINNRVDIMLEKGLVFEVLQLFKHGYNSNNAGMKGIGYREFLNFFKGYYGFHETVNQIKQNTRRYAKRQLTWFKTFENVNWFAPEQTDYIENLFNQFIKKYGL